MLQDGMRELMERVSCRKQTIWIPPRPRTIGTAIAPKGQCKPHLLDRISPFLCLPMHNLSMEESVEVADLVVNFSARRAGKRVTIKATIDLQDAIANEDQTQDRHRNI